MSKLPILDCGGCGVCCLHMGFPAFNLSDDQLMGRAQVDESKLSTVAAADWRRWNAMPDQLREGVVREMESYRPLQDGQLDGPCTWLDPKTRQCGHHQHRPQVCRDFEIGSTQCRKWRVAYQIG